MKANYGLGSWSAGAIRAQGAVCGGRNALCSTISILTHSLSSCIHSKPWFSFIMFNPAKYPANYVARNVAHSPHVRVTRFTAYIRTTSAWYQTESWNELTLTQSGDGGPNPNLNPNRNSDAVEESRSDAVRSILDAVNRVLSRVHSGAEKALPIYSFPIRYINFKINFFYCPPQRPARDLSFASTKFHSYSDSPVHHNYSIDE